MPRATVSTETERKELKSLPEGWVELKRLPFGRILKRRDMAAKTYMEVRDEAANGAGEIPEEIRWEMAQEKTRLYEFRHCIVDHNLEDEAGRKLDFSNEEDVINLDPKIGQEIEDYIDELNREITSKEEANFPKRSSESSDPASPAQPPA